MSCICVRSRTRRRTTCTNPNVQHNVPVEVTDCKTPSVCDCPSCSTRSWVRRQDFCSSCSRTSPCRSFVSSAVGRLRIPLLTRATVPRPRLAPSIPFVSPPSERLVASPAERGRRVVPRRLVRAPARVRRVVDDAADIAFALRIATRARAARRQRRRHRRRRHQRRADDHGVDASPSPSNSSRARLDARASRRASRVASSPASSPASRVATSPASSPASRARVSRARVSRALRAPSRRRGRSNTPQHYRF